MIKSGHPSYLLTAMGVSRGMVCFETDTVPGLPESYDFNATDWNATCPLPHYIIPVFHQVLCLVSSPPKDLFIPGFEESYDFSRSCKVS
jgi:hypothetical protein